MTVTEYLKDQVPMLAGISEEDARAMAVAVEQLDFPAGQSILMQGMTVDGLYVVATGKVAVMVRQKGKPPAQVAELGAGDVFGEVSIIESSVAGATIKALEETHVFLVNQDVFREVTDRNPAVKERVLATIASRKSPPPKAQA